MPAMKVLRAPMAAAATAAPTSGNIITQTLVRRELVGAEPEVESVGVAPERIALSVALRTHVWTMRACSRSTNMIKSLERDPSAKYIGHSIGPRARWSPSRRLSRKR